MEVPYLKRHLAESAAMPGRVFRLSVVEKGILKSEVESHALQFGIAVLVSGSGHPISSQRLQHTFQLLQRRFPTTRCKLVSKGKEVVMEEQEPFDLALEFVEGVSAMETFRQYSSKPLELETCAPLPRLIVVNPGDAEPAVEDDATYLLFCFNHALSDGISAQAYIHEFLDVYVGGEDRLKEALGWPQCCAASLEKHYRKMGRLVRIKQTYQVIYRAVFKNFKFNDFPVADYSITAKNIAQTCTCHNARQTLNEEETKAFLAKCTANGVTVGAAVGSAVLLAAQETLVLESELNGALYSPNLNTTLNIVCDMRTQYHESVNPGADTLDLGFHVSTLEGFRLPSEYKRAQGQVPKVKKWKLAQTIRQYTTDQLETGHPLAVGTLLWFWFKDNTIDFKRMATVALSNSGKPLIRSSYDELKVLDGYPILGFSTYRMPTVELTSIGNRLSIVSGVASPAVSEEVNLMFVERIIFGLKSMINDE